METEIETLIRDKHQLPSALSYTPTRDPASNPGICPDQESNLWPPGAWIMLNQLSLTGRAILSFLVNINHSKHSNAIKAYF